MATFSGGFALGVVFTLAFVATTGALCLWAAKTDSDDYLEIDE